MGARNARDDHRLGAHGIGRGKSDTAARGERADGPRRSFVASRVFVSKDGAAETLFASGSSGQKQATVTAPATYVYRRGNVGALSQ